MSTITPDDTHNQPDAAAEHCGQCGAPAAHEQRYCLNCGFHRRNAPDPVSRYLSEASAARAAVAAATTLAAQRRRQPRFGLRLVATLVALALLAGFLIGNAGGGRSSRSSGSGHTQASRHSTTTPRHKTKVKNVTGSSYLQQENSLPNSVTP